MEGGGFLVFGLGERVETASFPIYIYVTLFSCLAHIFVLNIHSRITLRSHIFLACLRGVVSLNFKIRRLVEHVSARVSVPRTNLNYG